MPDDELNNAPEEEQEEQEQHPIGQWWNPTPDEQFVETPIGGHVFPKKSRESAGMDN